VRLLVCGGRDYADRERVFTEIAAAIGREATEDDMNSWLPPPGTVIISGCATGADQHAIDWAVVHWAQLEEYPADWERYGKSAGHRRNATMLKFGKPDLVLAFPGGKGTANMIAQARAAGVPVKCIS